MSPEDGRSPFRERFVRSFLDWVMMSILVERPSYGYEMIAIISQEFGVLVSPGSLYPILYNLERSGFVEGRWDHPERKSRKVYELTPDGVRTYREGLETLGKVLDSFREPDRRPAGPAATRPKPS